MRRVLFNVLFAAALACSLSPARIAAAQSVASQSLFVPAPAPSGPAEDLLTLGETAADTVQSRRNGVETASLYGEGSTAHLIYRLPKPVHGIRFGVDAAWSAGNERLWIESGGQPISGSLSDRDQQYRLSIAPVRGPAAFWLRFAATDDMLPASAAPLGGALPLFASGTAPAAVAQWRRTEAAVGARVSIERRHAVFVTGEISPSYRYPSSLNVTAAPGANTPQLLIPLGASGIGSRVTLEGAVGHGTTLQVSGARSAASGGGDVVRPDLSNTAVGPAATDIDEQTVGVSVRRSLRGNAGALMVLWQSQFDSLATAGSRLSAPLLGFDAGQFDTATYYLDVTSIQRTFGITWDRPLPRGRHLSLDYRWLETPSTARYGYSARLFLVGFGQDYLWSVPNARGHLLHGTWTLPLGADTPHAMRLVVEGTQVIPLTTRTDVLPAPPPSPPGPSGSPSRSSASGGWTLSAGVAIPL
jgi:hypothetical protein